MPRGKEGRKEPTERVEPPRVQAVDDALLHRWNSGRAEDWDALIEAINPPSLLVVVESRMGRELDGLGPEDVLQESLLRAWQGREKFQWKGLRAFRSWVLTIIDHCIADLADRATAMKRGGDRRKLSIDAGAARADCWKSHGSAWSWLPAGSTTPSRVASYREQAGVMRAAIAELPEDVREVIRLRLFDQLELSEIAQRLNLTAATVRHRVRRGSVIYQARLRAALATRGATLVARTARASPPINIQIENLAPLQRADSAS